jgi:hypothetical protein
MNRTVVALAATFVSLPALMGFAYAQNSAGEIEMPPLVSPVVQPATVSNLPMVGRYAAPKPKEAFDPAELQFQSDAQAIIPLWNGSATTAGKKYTFKMVGKSPLSHQSSPVSKVHAVLIPLKWVFKPQNVTFDASVEDTKCFPHGSPLALVKKSPIFQSITLTVGSTHLGSGQYTDLFQRASFWKYVKSINPGYHVELTPLTVTPTATIAASNFTVQSVHCGKLGLVEFGAVQNYLEHTLIPSLKKYITPTTFPIFLSKDVVFYDGSVSNCCILGFHSSFKNSKFSGAFQSYGVSNFDTEKVFNAPDVATLSHEVAEWMDDPDVGNGTPPWGHIGQQSGCQDNLEVGDPLSGTTHAIVHSGFTYHVQDLANISWFYRLNPSIGANGWFSMFGKFKTPAKPCS